MRRSYRALWITIPLLIALAACTPSTPTATLRPTLVPTDTPQLVVTEVVTIDTALITEPPTWTPPPTFTEPPTLIPLATDTTIPTNTTIPTVTPAGGQVGIETTASLLTVAISADDLNTALAQQVQSIAYSTLISSPPKLTFASKLIKMSVLFNDFTQAGLTTSFDLTVQAVSGSFLASVTDAAASAGGVLNESKLSSASQLLQAAAGIAIPNAIRRIEPFLYTYKVLAVIVESNRMLVTVKLTLATPTPTSPPTNTATDTLTSSRSAIPSRTSIPSRTPVNTRTLTSTRIPTYTVTP